MKKNYLKKGWLNLAFNNRKKVVWFANRISLFAIVFSLFMTSQLSAQNISISTFAGNGSGIYSGDGGQADTAGLVRPVDVVSDMNGNVYIAENDDNRVRKVDASGTITTICGNGTASSTGDGGLATAATVNKPEGVDVDASGNIYICEQTGNRIRKIDASTGIISTIAGTGVGGFSGDGGMATSAQISGVRGVATIGDSIIIFSDQYNHRIRIIYPSGIIYTVAGTGTAGFSGDGGQASAAQLNYPTEVVLDSANNMYFSDAGNNRIRRIDVSTGVITTICGNGTASSTGDGGLATAATINQPYGLGIDKYNNIYIPEVWGHRIREINAVTGIISTIAGTGSAGYTGDGGPAVSATFTNPTGVDIDTAGNIYVADWNNKVVRELKFLPGAALNFDGTDSVDCGGILGASYTKEAWIKVDPSASGLRNIISGAPVTDEHAFWLISGQLSSGHNGNWSAVQDPVSLAVNTWYHIAVTYDASTTTMKLYKNGVLVSSNNAVPPYIRSIGQTFIGYFGSNVVNFWGDIDEVRIWDRALCESEISANMSGEIATTARGLVANYHFNQGISGANNSSETTLNDASGNGNDGTLYSFSLSGATSNWVAPGAVTSGSTITPFEITGTDVQTACDSYTWIDGNTYTASNNTATYIITGGLANGCDSIVTLDLTINQSTAGTDVQTACDTYTWIDGNTYTASNTTATYTLAGGNANGCDSVVTLNLTINQSTAGTDVQTACDTYTWIDGNTYTASNTTATHTLTNAAGCDSIVTLNLTINQSTAGTDVQTACDSYAWIDGNTYTVSNATATYTLTNIAGCDSVVTLNLTINNSNTGTDVQTACDSYAWIDGNTYTVSNTTATYTLTNAAGCDSVVTLNLTINTVDTSTTNTGNIIASNATVASYQWLDCDNNNAIIVGETSPSYTVTTSGNYAVEVYQNGCIDTSACVNVIISGISDINESSVVTIYPNPTKGLFTVSLASLNIKTTLIVYNVIGEEISNQIITNNKTVIDLTSYDKGIYFIKIQNKDKITTKRIIKQ